VKGLIPIASSVALTFSLTNTYNYERYGVPFQRGKNWYYSFNEGLSAQSIYYTLPDDAIDSKVKGTIFFNPNTLSDDGTLAVLRFPQLALTFS
jgi:prolyl oligopeptidase